MSKDYVSKAADYVKVFAEARIAFKQVDDAAQKSLVESIAAKSGITVTALQQIPATECYSGKVYDAYQATYAERYAKTTANAVPEIARQAMKETARPGAPWPLRFPIQLDHAFSKWEMTDKAVAEINKVSTADLGLALKIMDDGGNGLVVSVANGKHQKVMEMKHVFDETRKEFQKLDFSIAVSQLSHAIQGVAITYLQSRNCNWPPRTIPYQYDESVIDSRVVEATTLHLSSRDLGVACHESLPGVLCISYLV